MGQGQGEGATHAEALRDAKGREDAEAGCDGQQGRRYGQHHQTRHDADPAVDPGTERRGQQGADRHPGGGGVDRDPDLAWPRAIGLGQKG